jgi:hypothetical protein
MNRRHVGIGCSLLLASLLAAGCSAVKDAADPNPTLSDRQRDSVIARSDLPGARTVGRALSEVERSEDRRARYDAQVDSLTR